MNKNSYFKGAHCFLFACVAPQWLGLTEAVGELNKVKLETEP